MSSFTSSVVLEGRSIPSQTPVRLHAGPVRALLDPATAFLRRIQFNDTLVLNGIRIAAHDDDGQEIAPRLGALEISQGPDDFKVTFGSPDRTWRGQITGHSDGTIRYELEFEADDDDEVDLPGLCLLHDANMVSRRCVVEHIDGRRTETEFPHVIAAGYLFEDVQAITHFQPIVGASASSLNQLTIAAQFEGGSYRTEDLRSWSCAAFKTSSTAPASDPRRQVIEVRCRLVSVPESESAVEADARNAGHEFHSLPRLGLCMASHELPLNATEIDRLKKLQLDHLRCDLHLASKDWETKWLTATSQARALETRLHIALHGEPANAEAQLRAVAGRTDLHLLVDAWLIFANSEDTTPPAIIDLARSLLRPTGALITAGTNHEFAELNRNRPTDNHADALAWSANPQAFATDNLSLIESLEAQWHQARTAREIFSGELMISPITLRSRFDPLTGEAPAEVPPDVLPPQVDVRQMSLFGAAWTLGSIASLSREALLRSITYYETTGWLGVMEWSERPRLPHKFVTRPNWVFPVYFVFALLAGHNEVRVESFDPPGLVTLSLRQNSAPDKVRLLATNLGHEPTPLELPAAFQPYRMLSLDIETAVGAMRDPVEFLVGGWKLFAADTSVEISPSTIVAVEGNGD